MFNLSNLSSFLFVYVVGRRRKYDLVLVEYVHALPSSQTKMSQSYLASVNLQEPP